MSLPTESVAIAGREKYVYDYVITHKGSKLNLVETRRFAGCTVITKIP